MYENVSAHLHGNEINTTPRWEEEQDIEMKPISNYLTADWRVRCRAEPGGFRYRKKRQGAFYLASSVVMKRQKE